MADEPRFEEQAVSKAVEIGLSSQLNEADKINIDVKTDLLKAVQGQADAVAISGEGLVMQQDIRVQEVELYTDKVDINPLSVLFGQIELNQPIDASGRVVLTEEDINRALNSEYIRRQMPDLELKVEGELVKLELQKIEILIPVEGKIVANGNCVLHEKANTKEVGFTAVIYPRTSKQPLLIEGFYINKGDGISIELIVPLMQKLKELINLPYYEVQNMKLRVKDMQVEAGSLTLYVDANFKSFEF